MLFFWFCKSLEYIIFPCWYAIWGKERWTFWIFAYYFYENWGITRLEGKSLWFFPSSFLVLLPGLTFKFSGLWVINECLMWQTRGGIGGLASYWIFNFWQEHGVLNLWFFSKFWTEQIVYLHLYSPIFLMSSSGFKLERFHEGWKEGEIVFSVCEVYWCMYVD